MTGEPTHLQALNPMQYEAVTTLQGPLLILAGAGSGKTRVLTRRIAHLLYEGIDPENVFAVTFTNKAAAEMKERVEELVGEAGRNVWISTFHSACARILRQEIEALGYTKRFAIYDDEDSKRIVKEIVARWGYDEEDYMRPRKVLSRIDRYKCRMLTPEQVVAQHLAHTYDATLRVWNDYEDQLRAADAIDFNDLIGHTVRLFTEHPDVLERWRDRFHYLLVDEYQDTNKGQYRLLRLLTGARRNLAVVGDDDQSIYGFRGADIENILGFERDFPDAKVIRLEQNYRSTGHILDAANQVIQANRHRKEKALWTAAGMGRKVTLVQRRDPGDEAEWVARGLLQLRRRGFTWQDMAIVYRTNATSRIFERALQRHRIPHKIVGSRKFYERREVRDVLGYLRLVTNPADDAAFLRVCNVPTRGIGAKTLADLRDEAAGRGQPLLTTARSVGTDTDRAARALRSFVEIIDALAEASRTLDPAALVERVVVDSGYKAMVESEGKREAESRLANLVELIRDARDFEFPLEATTASDRLRAWLDRIALAGQDEEIPEGGQVTLLTVHNAKGLEYPVVFVVHMLEGQFPHERSATDEAGVEEERRLAYVAFTRARKRLVITWNREGPGTEFFSGRRQSGDGVPSRFLADLPGQAIEGDLPDLEPAMADSGPAGDREELQQRFGTFLRAHRERRAPPTDEALRLTEIEDIADLVPGRRVHHARFGVGEIRSLKGHRLLVSFTDQRVRHVSLPTEDLHLVED